MTKPDWSQYAERMQLGWDFSFSTADMAVFGHLSGDGNPLHTQLDFAKSKGFDAPVVYGLLLSSQLSRLIGQELPDKHAMLTGIQVDFLQPAYPDEPLRFDAELVLKSEATHMLEFKCRISRSGKILCRARVEAVWRP